MRPVRSTLLVGLICLPVVLLAAGARVPWLDDDGPGPRVLPVPPGDQEMAWLHTPVNWHTWERFVAGVVRAGELSPGLAVDASNAFRETTYDVPEIVVRAAGRPNALRIRWYKLHSEATAAQWVKALAGRRTPPLAIIGGGSSDRAADLARALARQSEWRGDRPLFFITTATADELPPEGDHPTEADALAPSPRLLEVYKGRSFRFCFSNRQMAEAVVDFVWDRPELRPTLWADLAPAAAVGGLATAGKLPGRGPNRPQVFSAYWQDDPFSTDLYYKFGTALYEKAQPTAGPGRMSVGLASWGMPFSVGGFNRPNPYEARVADSIAAQFRTLPAQRSLLVLPTVTQPARRLVRALALSVPNLGERMVAVTGDGISLNAVYRDGEFAWPAQSLPVPLVLFAHADPVAWESSPDSPLAPPTSTDELLHFATLAQVVGEAAFRLPGGAAAEDRAPPEVAPQGELVARPDDLCRNLRDRCPPFFAPDGERLAGGGEYVAVVRPRPADSGEIGEADARIEVWCRLEHGRWKFGRGVDAGPRGAGGRP